jgi:hypothetical protein
MHAMNPMVAVARVSPIAAEIFPMDNEELSPHSSILLDQASQILPDSRSEDKKVQS